MEQLTEPGERPIVKQMRRELFIACIIIGIFCLCIFTALYLYAPSANPGAEMRFESFSGITLPWFAEILKEEADISFMDPNYFIKFRTSQSSIQKLLKNLPDWADKGKWEEGKLDFRWRKEENATGENYRQLRAVTGSTVFWTLGIDKEKSVVYFEYDEM